MPDWFSILPPFLAIALAVWKREVISALLTGIWVSEVLIVADGANLTLPSVAAEQPLLIFPLYLLELAGLGFVETFNRIVAVFGGQGNTRVLVFGLLVGALLELMRVSGGVSALVKKLSGAGLTKSKRQVGVLASLIGVIIFMETSLSVLSAGVVSQKLFDRFKMSRARLAYIVDSTCAPISVLFLFVNAWGPYVEGLIGGYDLKPTQTILQSVVFNFYALITVLIVWYTAVSTKVYGPMRKSEEEGRSVVTETESETPTRARYMLLPLLTLIFGMIFFMFYTGGWVFREGSGSTSILLATAVATLVAIALLAVDRVFSLPRMTEVSFQGMSRLLPVVTVMLLSFAIGASCRALGTGPFVSGAVGPFLAPVLVAPLLFISAGVIAFTTGTSWGTFAILVPVGIPLGLDLGIPPAFVLSAILGGGVFGDHCSPISDTTIISSLASGCDHLEHVRTQMPYAVVGGIAAIVLYMVVFPFI
ncbi:MAG: Na+/H+ antiporter NhaC family protein [Acidobacteriota bacterium]|nr:Na+/H+ antiporter NhaC family protein [Acidobacteriota bacterium]